MAINYSDFQPVALAISAYAQERWTEAQRITSTGIVTQVPDINPDGESFVGQMRWIKPIGDVVNVASLSNSANGSYTPISTDIATYIKAVRTIGSEQVNLQQVISRVDGLAWFGQNFANRRAQDEHNAVLSVMKGIAASEAGVGTGVTTFDTIPGASVGAFVDINANGAFGGAASGTGDARKLVDAAETGARQGERIFRAMGMFWKDYEPEYAYLLTSPETLADLRAANLVEDDRVEDGNLQFQTLFGGKFRIVLTRSNQGDNHGGNVNAQSTRTTFVVRPGAIAFHEVALPTPAEVDRNAAAYMGGGSTNIWYRYGFVSHPLGYNWDGVTTAFPSNGDLATGSNWERKVDPLNLSILPIFHA